MSRAITESAMMLPASSRIGETVRTEGKTLPSRRIRVVSRFRMMLPELPEDSISSCNSAILSGGTINSAERPIISFGLTIKRFGGPVPGEDHARLIVGVNGVAGSFHHGG